MKFRLLAIAVLTVAVGCTPVRGSTTPTTSTGPSEASTTAPTNDDQPTPTATSAAAVSTQDRATTIPNSTSTTEPMSSTAANRIVEFREYGIRFALPPGFEQDANISPFSASSDKEGEWLMLMQCEGCTITVNPKLGKQVQTITVDGKDAIEIVGLPSPSLHEGGNAIRVSHAGVVWAISLTVSEGLDAAWKTLLDSIEFFPPDIQSAPTTTDAAMSRIYFVHDLGLQILLPGWMEQLDDPGELDFGALAETVAFGVTAITADECPRPDVPDTIAEPEEVTISGFTGIVRRYDNELADEGAERLDIDVCDAPTPFWIYFYGYGWDEFWAYVGPEFYIETSG